MDWSNFGYGCYGTSNLERVEVMNVKIGTWMFGKVVGFSEHGIVIQPLNSEEQVFARSNEDLKVGDEVQMQFKSFGIGCYWEAEYNGL
jgi:hypothetical protein